MKNYYRTLKVIFAVMACSGWAAVSTALGAAGTLPVRMQAVGTFQTGQPTAKLVISAAPDEREPGSFTVQSSARLSGVTCKLAGDLVSGKNRIPARCASIFVVEGSNLVALRPFDLAAGESKRLWISVEVPVRTLPGTYTAEVVAVAGGKPVGRLPLAVNVLPIRLLKSSKQYGLVFRQCAGVDDAYRSFLSNLRASGLFMVSAAAPAESVPEELNAIAEAGFRASLMYTGPWKEGSDVSRMASCSKAAGIKRVFYGAAFEPTTAEEAEAARDRASTVKQAGALPFAVIGDAAAFEQVAPSLNGVVFHASLPYAQSLLAGHNRNTSRYEWWYWDIYGSPKNNRVYAGWLLWKSKLDGAVAVVPGAADGQSLVNTLQWEGFREGIDDTRYATTLMAASREVKDALKAGTTRNAAKAKKVSDDTDSFLAAAFAKPLNSLSDSEYQQMRLKMARFTAELRSVLK